MTKLFDRNSTFFVLHAASSSSVFWLTVDWTKTSRKTIKCRISVKSRWHILIGLINLNYYLSFDVCPCFRLSVWVSFCKKHFIMVAHIKNVSINFFTFLKRIKTVVLFIYFFGSDLSKMDQTWSSLIQKKNFLMVAQTQNSNFAFPL